jgi:hypothetical protein
VDYTILQKPPLVPRLVLLHPSPKVGITPSFPSTSNIHETRTQHATNLQWVQLTNVLQIKPSLGWYIGRLIASSQCSSTNHRHPLTRRNERMLEVWFTETLQVCHAAGVVALDADLAPVACSPLSIA